MSRYCVIGCIRHHYIVDWHEKYSDSMPEIKEISPCQCTYNFICKRNIFICLSGLREFAI